MRFSRNQPGLFVSAIAHAGLLAATLIVFADAKKFEDAQEYVPVEILTDQQFNQITKGEAAAQVAPPALRVDKVAATDETKPQPPLAEAKRDIAAPPPPLKGLRDAEDENQPAPPKRQAALSQPEAKTAPAPTPEPQAKAPPEPDKHEAEATKPKPPPKPEPQAEAAPKPPVKPEPASKPKDQPRFAVDKVAKLLEAGRDESDEKKKIDKPAKPKSSDQTGPKSKFSAANIAALLSREAPQRRAATGKEATRTASLGSPTASAPRLSPSLQAQIDAYTKAHYGKCWAAGLSTNALAYVPRVEFRLTRDGALEESPRLINPSSDPVERSRGEQALAAVRRCSPMPIPAAFAPHYDYWRVTELRMEEM